MHGTFHATSFQHPLRLEWAQKMVFVGSHWSLESSLLQQQMLTVNAIGLHPYRHHLSFSKISCAQIVLVLKLNEGIMSSISARLSVFHHLSMPVVKKSRGLWRICCPTWQGRQIYVPSFRRRPNVSVDLPPGKRHTHATATFLMELDQPDALCEECLQPFKDWTNVIETCKANSRVFYRHHKLPAPRKLPSQKAVRYVSCSSMRLLHRLHRLHQKH